MGDIQGNSVEEMVSNKLSEVGPEVSDLLVSLLCASVVTYRRPTVCKPFPQSFMAPDGKERDFTALANALNHLPTVNQLVNTTPENTLWSSLPKTSLHMLNWLLNTKPMSLHKIPLHEFEKKTAFSFDKIKVGVRPTHIFQVEYTATTAAVRQFEELAEMKGTTLGFHGSAIENWHSILRNGLDCGFCKETSLFGDGIYLSEDPVVALNFVQSGPGWKGSMFGPTISCVGVCEVINDPAVVKKSHNDSSLPKTYVLVKNNTHLRLKYLLVYSTAARKGSSKGLMFLMFYIILLGFLFFMKSPAGKKWFR